MSEPVRQNLTEPAEHVDVVDLRDRALGESRRRTLRRRVGVAAALVVGLLLVGTAAVVWPRPTSSVQPVGPTPSITAPTSPAPPTPSPSTLASPAAGAPRPAPVLGAWQSSPAPSLPGTVVFVSYRPAAGHTTTVAVNQLANGTLRSATLGGPVAVSDCLYQSATVSPDGTKVAIVLGDNSNGGDELYVIPINGGPTILVTRGVSCANGFHPIWLPDSLSLRIATQSDGHAGVIDVATGAVTPRPELGGFVAFSPGGAFRAVADARNSYAIETAEGQQVRRAPGLEDGTTTGTGEPEMLGLSADGRYAAIGYADNDPQVDRTARRFIDTVTVSDVPPAVLLGQSGEVQNVVFLPGGGLVVQGAQRWYLLSGPGSVTATLNPAPAEIRIGQFAYLP